MLLHIIKFLLNIIPICAETIKLIDSINEVIYLQFLYVFSYRYFLAEIPEGYSLKSEEFEEGFQRYMISYSKGKDMLILKQTWQEDKFQERLTLDEDLKNIEVNGFTGYYSEDDGIGSLVLSNGVYKLVLGGTFAKDELVEMAGKLQLSDKTVE